MYNHGELPNAFSWLGLSNDGSNLHVIKETTGDEYGLDFESGFYISQQRRLLRDLYSKAFWCPLISFRIAPQGTIHPERDRDFKAFTVQGF